MTVTKTSKPRDRVTITLAIELHRKLRIAAAHSGQRIQALLDSIVQDALKRGGK